MKYKITIHTDDDFEKQAIIDAIKNKLLIDSLYDDVFRKVIKYSNDQDEIEAFQMVWDNVKNYLYSK